MENFHSFSHDFSLFFAGSFPQYLVTASDVRGPIGMVFFAMQPKSIQQVQEKDDLVS